MQRFKENDATEPEVYNLLLPMLETIGLDRDTFLEDAYLTHGLGGAIFDLAMDPISDVVTRDVYVEGYPAIHELFTRPGTFEFYLSVFRKIFADDVDVQFEIPGPGQLNIVVSAVTYQTFNLTAREIVDDVYVYSKLVTSDLNEYIMTQGVKGIKTQEEISGLLTEISAYGVFTTVELVIL